MGKNGNNNHFSLSLGQLVLLFTTAFAALGSGLLLLMAGVLKEKAITDLSKEEARQTSQLIFQSLYAVMSEGGERDEIQRVIAGLNRAVPDLSIRVYRGFPVIRQHGEFPGEQVARENDPWIMASLTSGREQMLIRDEKVRYLFPVRVKKECLECHKNTAVGDINGVIDITQPIKNIKISLSYLVNMVTGYFVAFMLVLSAVLYLKLRLIYVRPIIRLVGAIRQILAHMDFDQRVPQGRWARELRELTNYFNRLLTNIREYNEQLEELSMRDPLTGLYNRRRFEDLLRYEEGRNARYNHSFCLLLIDVDNFKYINDTFGHPTGDLVLKEIAAILEENLRNTDIVARIGGDEFGVLLPETEPETGFWVAEKVRQALTKARMDLPVGKIRISISIGMGSLPEDSASAEELLTIVDIALLWAKKSGKNQVVSCDGELGSQKIMGIYHQGNFLQAALEEDRVEAYLQPIMDVASEEVFGYEVLARIREGETVIAAGQFIEVAEELGLVTELDARVREKAFAHMLQPELAGKRFFLNLSAATLSDPEAMHGIVGRLQELNIAPERIVFEITERQALPHLTEIRGLIDSLRKEGVAFALDDFGSGFSSFLYLKYLTVDYVKIEGSFVRQIALDERDRRMVEHINGLSQEFGIRTIAEFVEDEATHRILRNMGVDFGQGYHYGEPRAG